MNDQNYNGWSNYETWVTNLWLDNDQGTQEMIREWAEECLREAIDKGCDANSIRNDAAYELGKRLEQYHDEFMPETAGVFADLLGHALGRVNWYEIAEHHVGDIAIYSAGWNMPGYLPDSDPALFIDADDALEHVRDAAMDACASEGDEWGQERENKISEWKSDSNGEFGQTIAGYHYFVTRV